jgi:hypothetical protein
MQMTTAVQSASVERYDVRTVVGGGVVLGVITAVGVVIFALLSRPLSGPLESLVQSALILAGGLVFAYYPAAAVRPRGVDGIAWAATLGLVGALAFTAIDTALLRPIDLYHWTWDAIGGGSGFWYIPVWWMGSALLAWLGAWGHVRSGGAAIPRLSGLTAGLAVLLFAGLVALGLAPLRGAVMALAFSLSLVAQVPLAAMLAR